MFKEKSLMFMYCISPVHMGAGTSLGVIDNPIQRERHTEHPVFAGSGIKGAMREEASEITKLQDQIDMIFGPESSGAEHAGAVSFSDGQLVAFPVRSLKEGYVYVTSPLALNRLKRLMDVSELSGEEEWKISEVSDEEAIVLDDSLLSNGKLVLETYEFSKSDKGNDSFRKVAEWISKNALPEKDFLDFFKEKIKNHLVLLSETQFSFFVRNATIVEPHVRIDDISGTAEDGGLFFSENVPPEAIFVSLVMASQERKKKGNGGETKEAKEILESLRKNLNNRLVQIGGDSTTGRGQVLINFVNKGEDSHENA